jgi:hypothetical protein
VIAPTDALFYFPVATWEEARALEGTFVQMLCPAWNGTTPGPPVTDEDLQEAALRMSRVNSSPQHAITVLEHHAHTEEGP